VFFLPLCERGARKARWRENPTQMQRNARKNRAREASHHLHRDHIHLLFHQRRGTAVHFLHGALGDSKRVFYFFLSHLMTVQRCLTCSLRPRTPRSFPSHFQFSPTSYMSFLDLVLGRSDNFEDQFITNMEAMDMVKSPFLINRKDYIP
jgi:hypothetical protein